MRLVKCRATGEKGNSNDFYKAPNGRYYKTESLYKKSCEDEFYKNEIITVVNKILESKNTICTSLILKLINESGLSPKIIYENILEKTDYIKKIISSSDSSNGSKIHSIFSIATKFHNNIVYAGCYAIQNIHTNEIYIGESINLFFRFTNHISDLYNNSHHCQKLQDEFNNTKDISDFKITPLFMFPVYSIDKNELKHDTLYLESAFYLIHRYNKENLYNTVNPYSALKNNSVFLDGYKIDCKKVLQLLYDDKYGVVPKELLKVIRENLKNSGICYFKENVKSISNRTEIKNSDIKKKITKENNFTSNDVDNYKNPYKDQIAYTNTLLSNNIKLYRINSLLSEFVENGLIPRDYSYAKIRKVLVENNLITIDSSGRTLATEYSLENGLYLISKVSGRNDTQIFNYYLSEKCKDLLIEIFSHKNINELKKVS